MIINVRGSFGSGKSTIIRNALKPLVTKEDIKPLRKPLYNAKRFAPTKSMPNREQIKSLMASVMPGSSVAALGSYTMNCGGADEYSWAGAHDAICKAIEEGVKTYKVFMYEGVTISGIYQRYLDLSNRLFDETGRVTHIVYNMPDIETCIQRVIARTGRERTDRMVESVTDKWRAVDRTYRRLQDDPNTRGISTHW